LYTVVVAATVDEYKQTLIATSELGKTSKIIDMYTVNEPDEAVVAWITQTSHSINKLELDQIIPKEFQIIMTLLYHARTDTFARPDEMNRFYSTMGRRWGGVIIEWCT